MNEQQFLEFMKQTFTASDTLDNDNISNEESQNNTYECISTEILNRIEKSFINEEKINNDELLYYYNEFIKNSRELENILEIYLLTNINNSLKTEYSYIRDIDKQLLYELIIPYISLCIRYVQFIQQAIKANNEDISNLENHQISVNEIPLYYTIKYIVIPLYIFIVTRFLYNGQYPDLYTIENLINNINYQKTTIDIQKAIIRLNDSNQIKDILIDNISDILVQPTIQLLDQYSQFYKISSARDIKLSNLITLLKDTIQSTINNNFNIELFNQFKEYLKQPQIYNNLFTPEYKIPDKPENIQLQENWCYTLLDNTIDLNEYLNQQVDNVIKNLTNDIPSIITARDIDNDFFRQAIFNTIKI